MPNALGGDQSGLIRKAVEIAEDIGNRKEKRAGKGGGDGSAASNGVVHVTLVNGSDIEPTPIHWIWKNWLAAGKLEILAGAPTAGKTSLWVEFAAIITRRGKWPDGTSAQDGSVLVWSGEDDPADTLLPRFLAAGGIRDRIDFVKGITTDGKRRAFDPSRDMDALLEASRRINDLAMFVVDPVVLIVIGDSHKNTEVRRGLQPLVDLAAERRCCALGVTHTPKGSAGRDPIDRVISSQAYIAGPRLGMMAARPLDPSKNRRLVRFKSNNGPDGDGFEYSLFQEPLAGWDLSAQRVGWGDRLFGPARQLLNEIELPREEADGAPKKTAAARFLADLLSAGPIRVPTVKSEAEAAGLSWATVRRACDALGVTTEKDGFSEGWSWRLPNDIPTSEEIEI